MPLKVIANQMATMEAIGMAIGANLKTTPMTMAKLQLCAHNADVEEVIEINDTTNIGNKNINKTIKNIQLNAKFSSQGKCQAEDQCWCVSRGDKGGLENCMNFGHAWHQYFGYTDCDVDECYSSEKCASRGYWCDDSLLKDIDGNIRLFYFIFQL